MIKKILTISTVLFVLHYAYAWGNTGHRVVGEVASKNIKRKTAKKVAKLLNHQSLASVSTFGDDIKSDDRYKKFYPWHYVNFNNGEQYKDETRNPEGDVVLGINTCIDFIRNENTSDEDKAFYLKLLVHLVGDLHQPLHVGHGSDKGGNDIKVKWFGEDSNLHRVWDDEMISQYGMSYTELANDLPYRTKQEIDEIRKGTLMDWTYESQKIAENTVYPSANPEEKLYYRYQYNYFNTVKSQLQKAGYRLAKILDEVLNA